jgi:tetratricopeptide (TPR) repeat protein
VLERFYLDSVYQTDEEKESIRRILLASPSALLFALHSDTEKFRELWSSWNQLDSSEATRNWFTDILRSEFETPLLEMLIADMSVPAYGILHATLQIRVAMLRTQVRLATPHGKYVEVVTGGSFSLFQATEDLRAGQLVSYVDPMDFCYDGVTFLNLGEFQIALENFDKALQVVQDPIQKATVLNNKGVAFLRLKQYQKAIEYFDASIALDSEGEISLLRENKQVAEEYLARATDSDNLTEPTQIRFVQDQPVPFEETRFYEFKEIKVANAVRSITDTSDTYAVAFLNREGGRIFWGIRDSDRITVGVALDERQRNDIRTKVSQKLAAVQPSIVGHWELEFHNVYDFQGEIVEDLGVVELVVPPPQRKDVFYTGSSELFVKTDGGKQKLQGLAITEFIRERLQNETETE